MESVDEERDFLSVVVKMGKAKDDMVEKRDVRVGLLIV